MQIINSSFFNDANLVSYYRLEDVNDSKGANTLTNFGSTTFETAKYSNGAQLNVPGTKKLGTNSSIGGLAGLSNWTVSFWCKLESSETTARQYWNAVYNSSKLSIGMNYDYNAGAHRLDFYRDRIGTATAHAYYNIELDTTRFHHFAMTYDGTNILGYYDGVQVASTTQSGTGGSTSTEGFAISGATTGTNGFVGLFDDFAIFSRTLSAAEIKQISQDSGGAFLFNFI